MSPNLVKQGSSFQPNQRMRQNYKQKELGDPADCFNRLPLARSGSILKSVPRIAIAVLLALSLVGLSACSPGKRITKANVDEVDFHQQRGFHYHEKNDVHLPAG
ncbi:MAG: hypothetical protein DMF37_08420 [Verrucomicrobia bacterium]|nr:MAG: hypothetical protein DMF37_08420 [Verrucomicrobiota bacterium]